MTNGNMGYGAIERKADPYGFYIGKWVEVVTQGGTLWGRYQGTNENGDITLRPSLRTEIHSTDKKEEHERIFDMVDEPLYINHNIMGRLGGLREEYMHSVIERREIIFPSKYH